MAQALSIDPRSTAIVLIDLQHSNVGRQLAPHSAADVVARSVRAADALRAAGGTVVFVRVDVAQLLSLPADAPLRPRDAPAPPPQASDLVPECNVQAGDLVVTKRQWGAFYGTDLEQQLRRRHIRTIALTGIATNFGVESTARAAFDQGYELIFIEDAMSGLSGDTHAFPIEHIFPRMGFVRSTDDFISAAAETGTFGGA
ncbi:MULTISPECIES: isochorismatase family protein [Paraburkholderia]|uniref:isochorismatase family protein n=1 Tax=Paraburkholderia TaxID=1822464 RepID=UPI001EE17FDF|nr:isochorismatase family protein [Paraburkholderia terrae]GJH03139.1 isochorismatase family protein [Paraburkholderia terrae]GJH37319.1 isochorismatase family protein [Paraburkholderia hospita]